MAQKELTTEQQKPDSPSQACFEYQNGSKGPIFCRIDSGLKQSVDPAWPVWVDALPVTSKKRIAEGGLRIQGKVKSGTSDMPLVSFVTVVRNNTATLERTIESVQQQ